MSQAPSTDLNAITSEAAPRARLPRGTAALLVLGAIIVAAMMGVLGGTPSPWLVSETSAGRLAIKTPVTLRSGLFFEQRIRVAPRQNIADLVLRIEEPLLRDMTINTMMPAASEEEFKKGEFVFHFGPHKAGEVFEMKIDGQINPPLTQGVRGKIAWFDGERRLGERMIHIKVLP